jgi:hypothetical protein
VDPDRKRSSAREPLQNDERLVFRTIVADDQLRHQVSLNEKAVELLFEIGLAIERCHCD